MFWFTLVVQYLVVTEFVVVFWFVNVLCLHLVVVWLLFKPSCGLVLFHTSLWFNIYSHIIHHQLSLATNLPLLFVVGAMGFINAFVAIMLMLMVMLVFIT